MDKETFNKIYRRLLDKASKKRTEKEEEYLSTTGVLDSFERIAAYRHKPMQIMIMDLGSKSLESISSMVDQEFEEGNPYTMEQWDEKFVDAVNYLLKLYASIIEVRTDV